MRENGSASLRLARETVKRLSIAAWDKPSSRTKRARDKATELYKELYNSEPRNRIIN